MKLIQKAILEKDNKFLAILRTKEAQYFPNCWDFPGGKLEPNEKPLVGIEREVLEETNLKVKALEIIGIYELDLDNIGKNTHRFTVYSTEIISGDIKISHEHSQFQWFTKEELLQQKTEPYIKLYFNEH